MPDKPKPDCELVEVIGRAAYALAALVITYLVAHYWIGLEIQGAKEAATLNAGVAYYTHEAAGRVIGAMNVLVTKLRRS